MKRVLMINYSHFKSHSIVFLTFIFFLAPASVHSLLPADSLANDNVKLILDYMAKLPSNGDKQRVISGQFLGYAGSLRNGYGTEILKLYDKTKKYVAMVATDFAFTSTDYKTYCDQLAKYWNDGHLISISYHFNNPGGSFATLSTNTKWISTLDAVAQRFQYLSDRGVVVFWRPFHEMNGDWFWWGNKNAAEFKAAWQHMFKYLTVTKKLHNIIWVYAPDDSRNNVTSFYPGDKYVDVVGLDNYNFNKATLDLTHYDEMIKLGKPFGLTEFSPKTNQSTNDIGDYSCLVNGGLKTKYTQICFFLCWDHTWGLNYNKNADLVMNDPWVIDRTELPVIGRVSVSDMSISLSKEPARSPSYCKIVSISDNHSGFNTNSNQILFNIQGKIISQKQQTNSIIIKYNVISGYSD
jgi:mannan endo-1,4-beta-mannosidase